MDYWIDLLDEFLKDYKNTEGRKMKHCDNNQKQSDTDVCVVDEKQFGPCSSENGYGYKIGKPCIFLKLNKIYGWRPDIYETSVPNMPSDLQQVMNNTSGDESQKIWVSCNGHFGTDKEQFQNITYYPSQGFPTYYYPYLNQQGYISPVVAVQFNDPPTGKMLDVECRAWAKNIIYSGSIRDRKGSVTFQFLMD